jgi:hypothetical protein
VTPRILEFIKMIKLPDLVKKATIQPHDPAEESKSENVINTNETIETNG